jgi:RND family efflux transporter MFP subunit
MSSKTRSIALSFIMLAGMVGAVYIWMSYGSKPDSTEAPTLTQKTNGKIMLDGTIVPKKNSDLGFVIPARIVSISKKVGDTVKAGEILAVQDNSDLKAQLNATQADAEAAIGQLDVLNHDLKKEKLKLHDVSGNLKKEQRAQVASNKASIDVQESAATAAQDGVASAQAQLAKTILRAPFNGVITRQDGEVGEVSGASVPAFMTVASSEPLKKIEAFASDIDVASIKVGDTAHVTFDFMGTQKTIDAKVTSVDPATNSSQGKSTYKVTLMLDNADDQIRSGMHANVSF